MSSSGYGMPDARGVSWKASDLKESRRKYNENFDKIFGKKEELEKREDEQKAR